MAKKKETRPHERLPYMKTMRCPYCRAPLRIRSAKEINPKKSEKEKLLVCSRYPQCNSYVGVHAGTKTPMGSPANKELRALRVEAHRHFNKLYKYGLMSVDDAYCWLARTLGVDRSQAHIGFLGEYYCKVVIEESIGYLEQRGVYSGLGNTDQPYARVPAGGGSGGCGQNTDQRAG